MESGEEATPQEGLKAGLDSLTLVGAKLLPTVAQHFSEFASALHFGSGNSGMLFRTPGSRGERVGPVLAKWTELRDALISLAGETAVNVNDAGMGLLQVVEMYGGTDAENVKRLDVPMPPAPGDPLPPEAYGPRKGED